VSSIIRGRRGHGGLLPEPPTKSQKLTPGGLDGRVKCPTCGWSYTPTKAGRFRRHVDHMTDAYCAGSGRRVLPLTQPLERHT
jgi:hypothetical protein